MNIKRITGLLMLFGIIYLLLGLNTLFGFFFTGADVALSIVLFINALVYLLGLVESAENVNRRRAHLLTGVGFSCLLSVFKVLNGLSTLLMAALETTAEFSPDGLNLPVVFTGFLGALLYFLMKRKTVTD